MKKLLALLFSIIILPISVYASDIYYCSDDARTGFDRSENLKQKNFNPDKFKVLIDFDNQKITAKSIFFSSDYRQKCFFNEDALYCINSVGVSFSINKSTLIYFYADLYNKKNTIQDPVISNGTCEKF